MSEGFIEERRIEPMNILIAFLIGIGAALFVIGALGSFELSGGAATFLMIAVIIVYLIVAFALLVPRKHTTFLPEPGVVEREVIREVEKPIDRIVEKHVIKYKDRPVVKHVDREVLHPVLVEKVEPKESTYVGSSYNDRYHLRTCRFAGAIKKEYLIEEDDKKYFKLRGYEPCKVCHPEKQK
jgi:predicted nucleic acid-binding protein